MLVSAAMESIAQISMNVQAIISTLAMPMHLVQIMMKALLALAMTNSKEMVLTDGIDGIVFFMESQKTKKPRESGKILLDAKTPFANQTFKIDFTLWSIGYG